MKTETSILQFSTFCQNFNFNFQDLYLLDRFSFVFNFVCFVENSKLLLNKFKPYKYDDIIIILQAKSHHAHTCRIRSKKTGPLFQPYLSTVCETASKKKKPSKNSSKNGTNYQ